MPIIIKIMMETNLMADPRFIVEFDKDLSQVSHIGSAFIHTASASPEALQCFCVQLVLK